MNCDDVFVILTRGPFPSGSPQDRYVEAHLQRCTDCQRLAEALRPNDDSLHELVGLDEGGALPGYWGEPLGSVGDLAISLTGASGKSGLKHLTPCAVQATRQARNLNVWQFSAAVALGIVVAAALRTLVAGHPARPLITATVEPHDSFYNFVETRRPPSAVDYEGTSFQSLPAVCRPAATSNGQEAIEPIPNSELNGLNGAKCCTDCHRSGKGIQISDAAKLRIARHCSACHEDRNK